MCHFPNTEHPNAREVFQYQFPEQEDLKPKFFLLPNFQNQDPRNSNQNVLWLLISHHCSYNAWHSTLWLVPSFEPSKDLCSHDRRCNHLDVLQRGSFSISHTVPIRQDVIVKNLS